MIFFFIDEYLTATVLYLLIQSLSVTAAIYIPTDSTLFKNNLMSIPLRIGKSADPYGKLALPYFRVTTEFTYNSVSQEYMAVNVYCMPIIYLTQL